MKTNLTAKEYAQLEPKARAKYRKLIKEYEATLNPVRSAKIKLENELRIQAHKDLNIWERVKQAEEPIRQQMAEVDAQLKELNEKWRELSNQLNNVALDIQTEPYQVAYNDPQVRALSAIWEGINETQEAKLAQLIAEFENANAQKVGA